MFSFVMFTIFWLKTHRYIITTHDECHKGKAVRNYSIKMSVHCLSNHQGSKRPRFQLGSRGSAFGRARPLDIPKPSISKVTLLSLATLQGGLAVSQREGFALRASPAVLWRTKALTFPQHCDNGGHKGSSCKLVSITDHARLCVHIVCHEHYILRTTSGEWNRPPPFTAEKSEAPSDQKKQQQQEKERMAPKSAAEPRRRPVTPPPLLTAITPGSRLVGVYGHQLCVPRC